MEEALLMGMVVAIPELRFALPVLYLIAPSFNTIPRGSARGFSLTGRVVVAGIAGERIWGHRCFRRAPEQGVAPGVGALYLIAPSFNTIPRG